MRTHEGHAATRGVPMTAHGGSHRPSVNILEILWSTSRRKQHSWPGSPGGRKWSARTLGRTSRHTSGDPVGVLGARDTGNSTRSRSPGEPALISLRFHARGDPSFQAPLARLQGKQPPGFSFVSFKSSFHWGGGISWSDTSSRGVPQRI